MDVVSNKHYVLGNFGNAAAMESASLTTGQLMRVLDADAKTAIDTLIERLKSEFASLLESVVLVDSYARGLAHSASDIDLLVVTTGDFEETRFELIGTFELDIKIWSLFNLSQHYNDGDYFINAIRFGQVLLDRNRSFSRLRNIISPEAYFQKQRAKAEQYSVIARHLPRALLSDVRALHAAKAPETELVLDAVLLQVLIMQFHMDGQDAPKLSRLIPAFELLRPDMMPLVKSVMRKAALEERVKALSDFVFAVTATYGDPVSSHISSRAFVFDDRSGSNLK